MRRGIAVLMMLLLLLFCGCKSTENDLQEAIDFRASLVQAGGCSFRAEITADFDDYVEMFTVDCDCDADGTTRLTIVSPENLQGITATVTDRGGTITFDGLSVDFGLLADGNVIPAAAPAIAVTCWSSEYIAAAGTEGELYRVTYEKDFERKRVNVDTCFKNGLPISSEVCYNNQNILKIAISEFNLN